jgi:hypothetical protein
MPKLFLCLIVLLSPGFVWAQEGPKNEKSDTVARPRKPGSTSSTSPEAPPPEEKIPSKYKKREDAGAVDAPSFRSDVTAVTVDVAVIDNKGRFIPNLKRSATLRWVKLL